MYGVSCSFFSIRSNTLERAPSFTDGQTDGQFNLMFQKAQDGLITSNMYTPLSEYRVRPSAIYFVTSNIQTVAFGVTRQDEMDSRHPLLTAFSRPERKKGEPLHQLQNV
uniref:SFRICE_025436 n=1 Tax=Spodoptera frugiperda TaxID=7108 RepID=A0A2H1WI03_SPOFR